MNTYSYLIKLFRDNFITLLHLYKFLNYKSSLIYNNYISLRDRYRFRDISSIIIIEKRKLGAKLSDIKNYQIL